ncbi:alpha/beta fold hydrolase [Thermodesulfobacteriota bacterium]
MMLPGSKPEKPMLYHEVHGTGGPFILLVHGMLSSRAQWIPNLEALTAFSRPVIVELFGHGRSPSPKDPECYTPDNYVQEFERIRCDLGVEQWFVCGQSLGASLTFRYALYHPECIIAQIFTNSLAALRDGSWDEGMKMLARYVEESGHKAIENLPLHPSRSRRLPRDIKNALIEDAKLIDPQGFSYTALYTVANSSVRKMVDKNIVPTLLIVGRHDKQFLPLSEFAEKVIPELEVVVFDGGHAVNIDMPEEFNEAVRGFMSRFIDI